MSTQEGIIPQLEINQFYADRSLAKWAAYEDPNGRFVRTIFAGLMEKSGDVSALIRAIKEYNSVLMNEVLGAFDLKVGKYNINYEIFNDAEYSGGYILRPSHRISHSNCLKPPVLRIYNEETPNLKFEDSEEDYETDEFDYDDHEDTESNESTELQSDWIIYHEEKDFVKPLGYKVKRQLTYNLTSTGEPVESAFKTEVDIIGWDEDCTPATISDMSDADSDNPYVQEVVEAIQAGATYSDIISIFKIDTGKDNVVTFSCMFKAYSIPEIIKRRFFAFNQDFAMSELLQNAILDGELHENPDDDIVGVVATKNPQQYPGVAVTIDSIVEGHVINNSHEIILRDDVNTELGRILLKKIGSALGLIGDFTIYHESRKTGDIREVMQVKYRKVR